MFRKALLFVAVLAMTAATAAFAQDEKKAAKITGYLVDNMCATASDSDAKAHEVSCAKMSACEKSGFAVVSKDVIYKLDAEGNKRALEILNTTKTKKGLTVEVAGTLTGNTLTVESIAEVKEESKQ